MKKKGIIVSLVVSLLCSVFLGHSVSAAGSFKVKAKNLTNNSVVITWDKQNNADRYRVYVQEEAGKGAWVLTNIDTTGKVKIQHLSPGIEYKIKVKAIKKDGRKLLVVSESEILTINTRSSSNSNSPFPDPSEFGFNVTTSSDFPGADYYGQVTATSYDKATDMVFAYHKALRQKGYKLDQTNSKTTEGVTVYTYNLTLNGQPAGMLIETYKMVGSQTFVSVALGSFPVSGPDKTMTDKPADQPVPQAPQPESK